MKHKLAGISCLVLVWAVLRLFAPDVLWAVASSLQTFTLGTAPGNPSSGLITLWSNTTTGNFACLNSSGVACGFDNPVIANHGTSRAVVYLSETYVCTAACTVTPLTPTEGVQVCVQNDDNVTGVITIAAVTNVQYEATTRSSYGTAGHTLTSGGALKDQICLQGRDATHYNIWSYNGTWTNN